MLFNSYAFIFGLLPAALLGFYAFGARGWQGAAIAWLLLCSAAFYGWDKPAYLLLLAGSVAANYVLGAGLIGWRDAGAPPAQRRALLALGIAANLALLGYFKYVGFFAESVNAGLGTGFRFDSVVLPLGISFYTFQQIAFLVDAHRGLARPYGVLRYGLFVAFFPQLIAGPIVHHAEMMPQFRKPDLFRLSADNLAVGATLFTIGLAKKVVLADNVAAYADPVFAAAADPTVGVSLLEAWVGTLAFTFQLYFDFSGYSDMALGLARLFGLRLPLNFDAPYKAASIIDFWRRWHMTLSRFLRDYLYFPLGGNRKGPARRHVNLMIVMLLGGLWHGAGWTFVLWGGLHGVLLIVNHAWRTLRRRLGWSDSGSALGHATGVLLTFLAVAAAWVLFRADDLGAALAMYRAMLGLDGVLLPARLAPLFAPMTGTLAGLGIDFAVLPVLKLDALLWLLALLAVVWLLPASQHWAEPAARAAQDWPRWWLRPALRGALAGALFAGVATMLGGPSAFLYFRF